MEQVLAGHRVLVVEDEWLAAMELDRLVRAMGGKVVGPTGFLDEAQDLAEGEIDAAVLDVKLDGQTSEPVADRLRARGVPLLLVTGYEAVSLPRGMADLPRLTKPFCDREVAAAVRKHLAPDRKGS